MVKKKIPSAAASSTSVGAPPDPLRFCEGGRPQCSSSSSAPPVPPSSSAKPGDWTASTVTKRDEKRSRSLGLISSDEGNVIFPDKTLLDTTCSGSFTSNKEEFKRDLLDRIKENAEDWENDKGYADKPPFKPLPPKEGNEEKKKKKKKKGTKKKKKKENKKKEVTAYPRVNEITLGNRKYVAPNDYCDNESEYDDLPMPFTYISDHDLNEHTTFDITNLWETNSENDNNCHSVSAIHASSHNDIESSKLGEEVFENPFATGHYVLDTSPSNNNDAGDTCDTEGSVRNDDADHNAFVDAAVEETRASPMKRSIGGFADEDDLLDFDDTFIEPPPKKARSDAVSPAAAASEASAPKAAPVAQASTASSLSKGKDAPAAALLLLCDIPSLEADKIRLQEEARSSSSKLDGAIKKAAVARQEVDSLKEELNKLKERLKEEEARAAEKDELLRQSALALLGNKWCVDGSHRPPTYRELLDKGKGALARMHSMIFPKATQEKTLGQLIDAFAVDTKEVIEVFKRTSRTYGALLAFQLMMGYGFKADIEEMTKELPKGKDGQSMIAFTASARTCARQLLDLVSRKTSVGPSLSTQTQAP
ncbi:hypothetical protein QYE76_055613 [Lolium multiflorum]|uniref:Uncharacterized protein n=1 Tax=Lolium multiflorum TaxID=4521 RepID=A0AAD8T134_LOLMU|nr:hypothetical protein QYE76_055613 [Lolium multiflorum]